MAGTLVRSDFSRVFTITGQAGPENQPVYQGLAKAGEVAWKQGDLKLVRIPDPRRYGGFQTVGEIPGDQAQPNIKTTFKYTKELSFALQAVQQSCPVDLQIHIGECQDPRNFDGGWDKCVILEAARVTDYATDSLGALMPSERAEVLENIPWDGQDLYEVKPMVFADQATGSIIMEIVDIAVCDIVDCGNCGPASDGCQTVFALQIANTGSPGLTAGVLFTVNGGQSWSETHDTGLPANQDPTAFQCIGTNLVIISSGDCSLTYAALSDIVNGVASWTRVATGLVCPSGAPTQLWSDGPALTWIVGKGGYIYFSDDPTSGVQVQDAGVASTQDYNDIYGLGDGLNLIAVGKSNAVVYTQNGGETWASVTGPNNGVDLLCCAMRSQSEFWIGDAQGNLWYSTNGGNSWTKKGFPHSGAGSVRDIVFGFDGVHESVGWMIADDGTNTGGRLFRTINAGFTWYVAPEGNAKLPTNKHLDQITTCQNPNVVFAAGLLSGTNGIILKGA